MLGCRCRRNRGEERKVAREMASKGKKRRGNAFERESGSRGCRLTERRNVEYKVDCRTEWIMLVSSRKDS